MQNLIFLILSLLLVSCGFAHFQVTKTNDCQVKRLPDDTGVKVICGKNVVNVYDGQDGADGLNGIDGTPGVLQVINPCGNDEKPETVEEVVLQLSDAVWIMWYKNVGLVVLEEGVVYRTTDKQRCEFMIQEGTYIEL